MSYGSNALSVQVAEKITEMISQRRFLPGGKLPNELELAEELGVSRTTLREALRILSTRGVLEVHRGRGTFVTRSENILDDFDVLKIQNTRVNTKDLYEMRLMFEPQAAYYACKRASSEELATILQYGKMDEQMIVTNDPRWDEYEQKFHNSIASATHNQFITSLLPIFNRAIHQGIILANQSPTVANTTLYDHRNIMQYLRERNAEGAKAAMHLHIINTLRTFNIELD